MSRRPALRKGLLLSASLGALVLGAGAAQAQSGMFVKRPTDPAAQAAAAAQARASSAANASAIAQRTLDAFARAAAARDAATSAQTAARAAAAQSQAALAVPNGLGAGGLQVAPGVIFDPSAITGNDDPRLSSANLWVGAKRPTQTQADGKTNVTIEQTQQKAILNWETFNVGRDTTVYFDQRAGGATASEWIALNRITDPSGDPTRIFGNIKAEGQVYLINQNGVIFGGTSQVNVHSIIASSLDFYGDTLTAKNKRFVDGLLFNPDELTKPALVFGEKNESAPVRRSPSNPNPVTPADVSSLPGETFAEGDGVTIDAGARITTVGGRAMMVGHNVVNRGTIEASDGEVVLAAGRGIYINKNYPHGFNPGSLDPTIRGITVGVNRGGKAENSGIISSARGSVNIQAKNIAQNGFIEATTSASANGYINLTAGDGIAANNFPYPDVIQAWGELRLGAGSTTQILPDDNGEKAVGFDQYQRSRLEFYGRYITFERDSTVFAPSAQAKIIAKKGNIYEYVIDPVTGQPVFDPFSFNEFTGTYLSYLEKVDDSRVYIDTGARIDISGLRGIDVAMSRNSIQGEVRANEVKDNPLLRSSFLRGRKVWFDARKGTQAVDLTGYYDLIERDVQELMTEAGSLQITGSDIITREGSTIDLSGGSLNYMGGNVRSTLLIDAAGNIVPIEEALPGVNYVGVYGDTILNHDRWGIKETFHSPFFRPEGRYEAGYVEGRSAGTLTLGQTDRAQNFSETYGYRILEGDVVADIVVGENQREAPAGATNEDVARVWRERPRGAVLNMGIRFSGGGGPPEFIGGNIRIGEAVGLPGDFTETSALDPSAAYTYVLPTRYFDGNTFSVVNLVSGMTGVGSTTVGGTLTIDAGAIVDLGDFGQFNFYGSTASVDGTIRTAGGAVNISATRFGSDAYSETPDPDWTNLDNALRPRITLGENGRIDVSGRWLNDFVDQADRPPMAINGGSVSLLTTTDLILKPGSLIDVSGGGRLAANGTDLTAGDAGSITLANNYAVTNGVNPPAGPRDGAFEIDGTLRGYALGKGGALNLATGANVIIGGQPVLENGLLEAGMVAPFDLKLTSDTIVGAGTTLSSPTSYIIRVANPGQPLPVSATASVNSSKILVTAADWIVPAGFSVRAGATTYAAGQRVPAGSRLLGWTGALPAGFVAPANVFPDGIPINAVNVTVPAGTLARALLLPALTVIPKGSTTQQTVAIVAPQNLSPEMFSQGGFARFAISGSAGITVQDNTVIAPTVQSYVLDGMGRSLATGANLYDVAKREVLPDALSQPMTLVLSNPRYDLATGTIARIDGGVQGFVDHPGSITMGTGSEIRLAPESTVRLLTGGSLFVDGTISAPGGLIDLEVGYAPRAATGMPTLRLGANARLLATGYVRTVADGAFTRRIVEDGGQVTLGTLGFGTGTQTTSGNRFLTDVNSVIDVSGIRGTADLLASPVSKPGIAAPYVERIIDGNAGSVSIVASGAGVLAGTMLLAPGGEAGRGGTLDITEMRGDYGTQIAGAANITVSQHVPDDIAAVTAASQVDPGISGLTVYADRLNASGADHLSLRIDGNGSGTVRTGALLFDGDVSLTTRGSIRIGGPLVAAKPGTVGDVSITSSYVLLNPRFNDAGFYTMPAALPLATKLDGSFTVNADLIDVRYGLDFGCGSAACVIAGLNTGFADVNLISKGDIRLDSQALLNGQARLAVGGDLTLDAAQVYATRALSFRTSATDPGFLINAGKSVTVRSNGAPTPVPYSYGERLTFRAPTILQAGVVRAPMGEIRLEATESLTLAPGSLTSTSLEGLIMPFGVLDAIDPNNPFQSLAPNGNVTQIRGKSVTLSAPDVVVGQGATIDVSGGGDVRSWQFVAGNGGSKNVMLQPGMFAIVPSYGDRPTATGGQPIASAPLYVGGPLNVGDKVYLEGVPGLAAGEYTLLPVDYALLDGGMLIQAQTGNFADAPATVTKPDGSSLVGGYRISGGVSDQAYTRFLVMPQKVLKDYSEFVTFSYNDFVTGRAALAEITARTARDAGSVVLGATRTLQLDGIGKFGAAEGGLLGNLDISAQKIAIVGAGDSAPTGFLAIDGKKVSDFGAGSVFIGGTRAPAATGTTLTVNATDIMVANDAASALIGPELVLGAKNSLTIGEGAVITASGAVSSDTNPLLVAGNGALIRATTGERVDIVRTGANGTAGILDIQNGARLGATGSLSLDGSRNLLLDPGALFEAGQLDLGSVRVSIGDVPDGITGTVLSGATLANLGKAADLLIRGTDSIDLYGNFALGGRGTNGAATLGALTFDTARLNGMAASGEVASITAAEITLRNSGAASTATPVATSGKLKLDSDSLILGPGEFDITGFASLDARTGVLQAVGLGGIDFAGPASIAADLVTAAAGSDYNVRVGGDLSIVRAGGAAQSAEDFGGRLALFGRNVLIDTRVDMPSGVFEASATGGNLMLDSAASLNAKGSAVDFRDVVRVTSGGTIRLAATGNVDAANGAAINVSGHERGGDAGWLEVEAGGQAALGGTITGTAANGYHGGGIVLDAQSVADFGALNAVLEAGGMDHARAIHVRQGDLALAAGQTLTAHDVLLRTDAGQVAIAGTIKAAGSAADADGGTIRLVGGSGVSLAGTAKLDARAGATGDGDFAADSGFVEIAATGGRVNIAQGALVDVTGGKQGGGEVLIRADRVGNDIAIDRIDGQFTGARDLGIAGVRSYQTSNVTAALRDTMLADAAAWMQNASAIKTRIGAAGFEIRPGISVESTGNLTIGTDINLAPARYGAGAPGYLDFVAAGDIIINGNISDGFAGTARNAALLAGRSWSYGFEAGRDVNLGAGKLVRTGTGDIRIDAGRDLVFADNLSNLYTAGSRTATQAGFTPVGGRVTGEFPTLGGDIVLNAGRDILAPVTRQSTSAWLFRYGDTDWTGDPLTATVAQQTSWSIVFGNFEQSVGALGGGNVDVNAGRDISQLAVALPTTGHMTTTIGGVAQTSDIKVRGGGDLTLTAGRDIKGGVFHLGLGQADVVAGGRLTQGDTLVATRDSSNGTATFTPRKIAALFGLADATLDIAARAGAEIEGVYDPMLQGQICQNSLCTTGANPDPTAGSAFFGMTERTAMNVVTASGDVSYNGNPWASVDVSRGTSRQAISISRPVNDPRPTTNGYLTNVPGAVQMVAMQGNIALSSRVSSAGLSMAPTDNGNLELIASKGFVGNFSVTMQDVDQRYRRGARHAFLVNNDTRMNIDINLPTLATNYDRGFVPTHINDADPARIYSMTESMSITATLPKPLHVYSGKDLQGNFTSQNNRPTDLSSFVAERDITSLFATVTGIGDAVVEAGRDIKFDFGGIVSAGNFPNRAIESTRNLALSDKEGANIYMFAGTAKDVDYAGFTATYLDPQNKTGVVKTYLKELADYMVKLGYKDLTEPELVAQFNALPAHGRKAFAQQILFAELKETGIDYNDPDSPRFQRYDRGYDAIKRLFPLDTKDMKPEDRANIILNARAVQSNSGGNITVLAPYGRIEVGGQSVAQPPEQGGIVTRKGGDIRIMADKNIDLFSSRVFTLQGGDITMWTSNGDITAGVGAKTTVFRPPLVYNITNDGLVAINVFGLQTGAGIGVLDAGGTGVRKKSRLDLIAPRGEVNAGDAGIRVVGDLNIAALRIVGLDNIQVTGEAVGLPEIVQVNMGALTAASAATSAVTKAAEAIAQRDRTPIAREVPSIITSRFLGFGEE
jgi:filamentous hemagglutinin family protein